MGGYGVAQRVHGGEVRPAGGCEGLVGFQNDSKLYEVITPDPDQRARALSLCDGAGMGMGVAKLTKPHFCKARGEIEERRLRRGHDRYRSASRNEMGIDDA